MGQGAGRRRSRDPEGQDRAHGARPELGRRLGRRRPDRAARALQGPLPLARRRPIPALRPPQPGQLRPRDLQLRRWRRPAHGPGHLRLHRRDVPGLAPQGRGHSRRCQGVRVRAHPAQPHHRARPTRAHPAAQTVDRHEPARVVQRRLPRPLPLGPGRTPRGPGRGPERREPAPVPVGQPLHGHRGVHRRAPRLAARRFGRLRVPGEQAAPDGPHDPHGPQAPRHALVHGRPGRGRDRRHDGVDPQRMGRRVPRAGRHRRRGPLLGTEP